MFKHIYWFFSYLGVMTLSAAFIMGFRHETDAPIGNLAFNVLLYLIHFEAKYPGLLGTAFGDPELKGDDAVIAYMNQYVVPLAPERQDTVLEEVKANLAEMTPDEAEVEE